MFIPGAEVPIVLGPGGVRLPQPTRQRSKPKPKTTAIATDVFNFVFILELSIGLFRCRTHWLNRDAQRRRIEARC